MKFSRKEYWSGSPFPSPEDPWVETQELKPSLLHLLHWQMDSLPLTREAQTDKVKTQRGEVTQPNTWLERDRVRIKPSLLTLAQSSSP